MDDNAGGIFQSIRFWQGWAVLGTAAALFAYIANAELVVGGHTPDYVAVIGDEAAPLWVASADLRGSTMHVRAEAAKRLGEGEQHVLWISGPAPQRLGALPVDRARSALRLTDTSAALLRFGRTLAISVEAKDAPAEAPPAEWAHVASVNRL